MTYEHLWVFRRNFDLAAAVFITLIAGGVVFVCANAAVPVITGLFGILLIFLLPGYALTEAFFPKRSLGSPERLGLAIGLSMAITATCGIIINVTPFGMQARSWAVSLSCATLVAIVIAYMKRVRVQSVSERYNAPWHPRPIREYLSVLLGILAMVIAGAALIIAHTGVFQPAALGFTQLWMIPAQGNNGSTIRIGMSNHEPKSVQYRLELRGDDTVIQEWQVISLKPNATWEVGVILPMRASDSAGIDAILYRLDAPNVVYRRVHLAP